MAGPTLSSSSSMPAFLRGKSYNADLDDDDWYVEPTEGFTQNDPRPRSRSSSPEAFVPPPPPLRPPSGGGSRPKPKFQDEQLISAWDVAKRQMRAAEVIPGDMPAFLRNRELYNPEVVRQNWHSGPLAPSRSAAGLFLPKVAHVRPRSRPSSPFAASVPPPPGSRPFSATSAGSRPASRANYGRDDKQSTTFDWTSSDKRADQTPTSPRDEWKRPSSGMDRRKKRKEPFIEELFKKGFDEFHAQGGFKCPPPSTSQKDASFGFGNNGDDDYESWRQNEMNRKSKEREALREESERKRQAEWERRDAERERMNSNYKAWQREERQRAKEGRLQGCDFRSDGQAWRRYEARAKAFFGPSNVKKGEDKGTLDIEDVPFPPNMGEGLMRYLCNDANPSPALARQMYRDAISFWHPDKFRQRFFNRFPEEKREEVMASVTRVSQIIIREYEQMVGSKSL